ncbi:MAG: hypothetical protein J2P27_16590 [Actinobacteria bacterium]|nr:hypothetical protein [Actinomycetota bacterium]
MTCAKAARRVGAVEISTIVGPHTARALATAPTSKATRTTGSPDRSAEVAALRPAAEVLVAAGI